MKGSIHGVPEYLNFHYTFTFSTIVAMIPWIYMIPTVIVMLKICQTYFSMKAPSMDRHIFICIAFHFASSFLFFLANYIRITLPSTGLFTSWCARVHPNHFLKAIFFVCFYCNYCVLVVPFFMCLFRLTILTRPLDFASICPKIMKVALPLLFVVPFGCTVFMIPAVGYCRKMGPPLKFGAVYIYYSGEWSGWRNSYIHLLMSVVMCLLTIACICLTMFKLRKVTATAVYISSETKKASVRAETSLTITIAAYMITFVNNTIFTIVYLYLPDFTFYLMMFRPFVNDVETVVMPWILYLTHPMMRQPWNKNSARSTFS